MAEVQPQFTGPNKADQIAGLEMRLQGITAAAPGTTLKVLEGALRAVDDMMHAVGRDDRRASMEAIGKLRVALMGAKDSVEGSANAIAGIQAQLQALKSAP